jgi:hypothetical protein
MLATLDTESLAIAILVILGIICALIFILRGR